MPAATPRDRAFDKLACPCVGRVSGTSDESEISGGSVHSWGNQKTGWEVIPVATVHGSTTQATFESSRSK